MTQPSFRIDILPADSMDAATRGFLIVHATRDNSDFQQQLARQYRLDGHIALVLDHGEVVGWARSEAWKEWQTLEAFVRPEWRWRGIATLASLALRAAAVVPAEVAVFRPSMILVADRAGYRPTYFRLHEGQWEVAE